MSGREEPGHAGPYKPQKGVGMLYQKNPSFKTQEHHGLTYVFEILLGLLCREKSQSEEATVVVLSKS